MADLDFSVTLHEWIDGPEAFEDRRRGVHGPQLGQKRAYDGCVELPGAADRTVQAYVVLWEGDKPLTWFDPNWLLPGDAFTVGPSPLVSALLAEMR